MWPETLDDYPKPLSLGQLLKQKLQQNCSQQHEVLLASSQCTLAEVDFSKVENRIHITGLRQPQKQEPQMDIQKLIALADPSWEKDLQDLGLVSESVAASELKAELDRLAEEDRKEALTAAATEIRALGRHVTAFMDGLVNNLRSVRAQEKYILKQMADVKEAKAYGSRTMNYLPMALVTGAAYHHDRRLSNLDKSLLVVQPLGPVEPKEVQLGD